MDDLLLAILEIVTDALIEILLELGIEAISKDFEFHKLNSVLSVIGLAITGAACGFLFTLFLPHRLIAKPILFPGMSLLLSPIVCGTAMQLFGNKLRRAGRQTSPLATLRGGAIFAFSFALFRLCLIP